jgi:PPK2 family polyphosphate:nucleotide phosphotransferase
MPRTPRFAQSFRVTDGARFRLKDVDPADTLGFAAEDADKWRERHLSRLTDLQEKLYAQDQWGLLLIFQAMDAAGKDGTIKHVMSGVNPQGCQVSSFKHPSPEVLAHDFLWNAARLLPERGRIGIFNRSYYEEVLIVRVRRQLLEAQMLPEEALKNGAIWRERYHSIRGFERHLHLNGTRIIKFYLHLSKGEQRKRLIARLDDPDKHWKFDEGDVEQRKYWDRYMEAYEACISETSTAEAPWYVVPADDKKNARLIVSRTIIETLDSLPIQYPKVDAAHRKQLERVRKVLESDG